MRNVVALQRLMRHLIEFQEVIKPYVILPALAGYKLSYHVPDVYRP